MLPLLTTQATADPAPAATPEDSGSASPDAASKKVELDLEGAPFLQEEQNTEVAKPEEKAPAVEVPAELPSVPTTASKKKKIIIVGGIALVVLLASAVAAYFLLFSKPHSDPAPDTEAKKTEKTQEKKESELPVETIVIKNTPQLKPPAVSSSFTIAWPEFWVELQDPEGDLRFLVCQLTFTTDSQLTALEMEAKKTVIRDAIYYYLRNKPYSFLADPSKHEAIRNDIKNNVKEYLFAEQRRTMAQRFEAEQRNAEKLKADLAKMSEAERKVELERRAKKAKEDEAQLRDQINEVLIEKYIFK